MKTKKVNFNAVLRTTSLSSFLLIMLTIAGLTSCQKDDDVASLPFDGTYTVQEEGDEADDYYTIRIERESGNNYLIHNFADFMNVGVKATSSGNNLTIPSQTFTNSGSGKSITVSGTFTYKENYLEIQYNVSGFAGDFSSSGKAIKK